MGKVMQEEFRLFYKILKRLKDGLKVESSDIDSISPESLNISPTYWRNLMDILVSNGYIKGVEVKRILGGDKRVYGTKPEITLKGLEYLEENNLMKRARNLAKGIGDIIH